VTSDQSDVYQYNSYRNDLFSYLTPRIKLRSSSVVSKYCIYRFLLDHIKLLMNVNCGVKLVIVLCVNSSLNHTHVLLTDICGVKWYVFTCFRFCTLPACSRFPVSVTYLSHTKSELAWRHRLISNPNIWIDLRIFVSICIYIVYIDWCMSSFIYI